ncbi:hypothetical protein SBA2_130011 [Acidobacteriia bacterium SbA2]|nr:hypothetical protein SBA2_130011 [Acidobacteriia bacterium SbA2]
MAYRLLGYVRGVFRVKALLAATGTEALTGLSEFLASRRLDSHGTRPSPNFGERHHLEAVFTEGL